MINVKAVKNAFPIALKNTNVKVNAQSALSWSQIEFAIPD